MIAFVMSGGGNRGALQAGALVELFERGIKPDILVGTSAGAINAGLLALDPTLEGAKKVAKMWETAKQEDFFPGNWADMGLRLLRGQSLFSSDPLRKRALKLVPKDKRTFGSVQGVKLYITTSNLNTGRLNVWSGDDHPEASIIDAVMASVAHPLAFPPVVLDEMQYVDGGVAMNVPVGFAVKKGADEVYILNLGDYSSVMPDREHIVNVLLRSLDVMMMQPFLLDVRHVTDTTTTKLHHITLHDFDAGSLFDISKCKQMVQVGKFMAQRYLDNPTGMGNLVFEVPAMEEVPDGAEVYVPDWMK